LTLDESKNEDDILNEEYGISMVSEKKLASYMEGVIVDYVESHYGGGFEIKTSSSGSDGGCGDTCGGCG